MRKLLAGGLAAGLLVTGAPSAHAHPNYHYLGGCRAIAVNDPTREAGWQSMTVYLVVVATTANGVPAPTASVSAYCELTVNGASVSVVDGPSSGTGVVAATPRSVNFQATGTDVISICEHVTVNGEGHVACSAPNTLPVDA